MKSKLKYLAGLVMVAAAGVSQAAIDISADVTSAKGDISVTGALIIGVCVSAAAIAWVRRVIR